MKKELALSLLTAMTAINVSGAMAASNYQYSTAQPVYDVYNSQYAGGNLQGYALYVPAGTTCQAVLSQEINSQSATVGQVINAILTEDFTYNGTTIATAGSTISGTVVSNRKAGFGGKNAQMQIRFTTIRTPYNNVIPISAIIVTDDSTGILKGGTAKDATKEYAKDTVIGAGAGAALGTAMGALSGGSVGKGAIYGTAIGGGLGVAKAVATKGEIISIPANSRLNLVFDQPITLGAQ